MSEPSSSPQWDLSSSTDDEVPLVPAGKPRKKSFRQLFSRDEFWYYGLAAVVYILLGILLKSIVLNWIVGPLFIVVWMWCVPPLVDRWRNRRP